MHEGTVMKRGQAGTPAQKKYRKTIRRRKALLYLVLLLSFVLVLNVAVAVSRPPTARFSNLRSTGP